MIIRNEEHKRKTVENLLGGSGKAHFKNIIETPEELYDKGRVFSFITLDPGAECGWHVHKGDGEYYCILEGEGEYSDNGILPRRRRTFPEKHRQRAVSVSRACYL